MSKTIESRRSYWPSELSIVPIESKIYIDEDCINVARYLNGKLYNVMIEVKSISDLMSKYESLTTIDNDLFIDFGNINKGSLI